MNAYLQRFLGVPIADTGGSLRSSNDPRHQSWAERGRLERRLLLTPIRSRLLPAVACVLVATPGVSVAADWSEEKRIAVTEYMQQYRRDWTLLDTESLLKGNVPHAEATVFVQGRPINQRLRADDGRFIPIEVFGQTVLVDGKDLSGNLGSKTTYGINSPIIEGVRNSQITTGAGSAIHQSSSNYTLNLSLSVALTLSVAGNLYLWRKIRRWEDGKDKDKAHTA